MKLICGALAKLLRTGHRGLGLLAVALTVLLSLRTSASGAVSCESLFYLPNEKIANTGMFPADYNPTLRELMAPNAGWAKSGKHASLLTRIYADRISFKQGSKFHPEDFVEYGEPVQLTKTLLREALAVLQRYKFELQDAAERQLVALLKKSSGQSGLTELSLNSKLYRVVAKLNLQDSVESDVYLVEFEGRLAVIKQFVDSRFPDGYKAEEAFRAHLNFYETVGNSNFRFAKPIEIDRAQKLILFEFSPGLNYSILKKEVDEKRLPDEVFKAYVLVQAAFANTLIRTMASSALGTDLKKQNYLGLDPHANNTIYDPLNGEWIVIDPY